jgi:hypothetical protein
VQSLRTINPRQRDPAMEQSKQCSTESMTIGNLARAAGVNVETIRYYQRIGLADEPVKPSQGYRHYPDSIPDTHIGYSCQAPQPSTEFRGRTTDATP